MYLYHFGFSELPFTLTPNTDFFVDLQCHHEALQVLKTAVYTGEGFIKVTGEVGTGKTMICRKFMNELADGFVVAYVPNPYLTPNEMRWALAAELGMATGVEQHQKIDQQQLTQMIQYKLLEISNQSKAVLLIVDEAQALPDETLEALRLFTNLETESRKLLQVVLFAQPELNQRLEQEKFRQLRQRITFSYDLRTMTQPEVKQYIQHRVKCAGSDLLELFDQTACNHIAKASRGIPRLVNILSHKALMLCFGQGEKAVTTSHIRGAVKDTADAHWDNNKTLQLAVISFGLVLVSLAVWAILGPDMALDIWSQRP